MKSKRLVAVGIILMVASLVWAAVTFFVEPKVSMTAGHIEISAIEPEDAINLFIFVTLFFGGIGLVIKGFIEFSPASKK